MTDFDTARRILVTGAGRGLGLEFVRRWLESGHHVFALARNAHKSPALAKLKEEYAATLSLSDCDVSDDASVQAAADNVGGEWNSLDVLVNNAGVYGPKGDSIETIDLDEIRRVFEVNTLGPLRVSRAFLHLIRNGRQPRVVHVTSLMGSIDDNTSGGSYPYRMSKTGLNMASRNLAHDLETDGVISAVIHPGWVRTGMGGDGAPLEIEDSVGAMIETIESLDMEHSGGFFDRNGERLPW
jgi:NAD(P)-dependent dehydrogenase (short-subunit alcohol dehydrogenase family)